MTSLIDTDRVIDRAAFASGRDSMLVSRNQRDYGDMPRLLLLASA